MPLLELGTLPLAAQALQDLGLKGTLALIPSWQVGLEQPPSADLPRLAAEGYQSNEVVYACVLEIASTAAEVRLQVVDGQDTALPHHPLQRLLDRPNPEHSSFELLEALLTDLLVYGNAFLLKERSPLPLSSSALAQLQDGPPCPSSTVLAASSQPTTDRCTKSLNFLLQERPLPAQPATPPSAPAPTTPLPSSLSVAGPPHPLSGWQQEPERPGAPLAPGRSPHRSDSPSLARTAAHPLTPAALDALWKLRPDRISIVPGARRLVDHYIHRVGDRETRLAPADVIHLRLPHPTNDLWGLSPVQVAARQIDTDNEASKFVDAFFRNAAVPFGIIKLKRTLRGGEAEARRLGHRWTDRFRGLLGRFQVGVLDADAEFQRIGLTQDEMAFPDLRAQTEARICAAFRVPPILVGVKVGLDRATFSNMAEARRFFWENTMLSLYRRIESKLAADLTPEFALLGEQIRIRFDFSDVTALRQSRESVERSTIAALRAGALSVNDARRRFGLPPLPDGDALPTQDQTKHSVRPELVEGPEPAPNISREPLAGRTPPRDKLHDLVSPVAPAQNPQC